MKMLALIKNTLLSITLCVTLVSCAGADAWLVKNTGLTSTDIIVLGVKNKDRAAVALAEYQEAKAKNMTSAKGVVEVGPVVQEPSTIESGISLFDKVSTLWNLF